MLSATYLQDIRTSYPDKIERDEWRVTRNGLLHATLETMDGPNSILSADLKEKALISEGRVIDIPVIKKGSLVVTNVRSCVIGDYENESDMVNLVWTTLVVNFSMIPSQYKKNEIAFLQDLNKKLILVKEAFADTIEEAIYTKLDTDKSIIYNSSLVGAGAKYPLVANTQQVVLADQPFYYNDLGAIQKADEFHGDHMIFGSTNHMPPVQQYINQGAGNAVNQNFQFNDKNFRFSNAVVDGAGVNSTAFAMPEGSVGVLTRVNIDADRGAKAGDGTEWSVQRINGLPFDVGVMFKSICDDESGQAGLEHLEATEKQNWQFSIDYALVTAYNSDPATIASGIKKLEFLNV